VVDAVLSARSSDVVPASSAARRALGLASSGWAPDLAWASLALGWVALAAGKPATARRRGLDLAAVAEQLGWPSIAAMGRNMVAVADVWAGRAGQPDPEGPEPGDPVLAGWSRLWRVRAAAWSTVASGRPEVGAVASAAHAACDVGDLVTGLELASDLRRMGEPRLAREVLERCRSGPAVVTAELAAAQAALTGDPQVWAEAAEAFSARGARGQAAECLVQWAEVLGGRRAAAGRARADEALAGCEGLRTPLAHRAHASLTAREREVAVLAADGVPSSHIAERLGISPRTVDNLLARCYTKLQVAGRRELPEAMGLRGGSR
jgi:DNA-binding CsgD family transcriptional regulator